MNQETNVKTETRGDVASGAVLDHRFDECKTGEDCEMCARELDMMMRRDLEREQIKYEAWGIAQLVASGLPPRYAAREFYDHGMARWSNL